MLEPPDIPGADKVISWFGYWPTFHDAEIVSIYLDRSSPMRVRVHAFEMRDEVNERGFYVLTKHAIVTFVLEEFITDTSGIAMFNLAGFNHQNSLLGISLRRLEQGYEIEFDSCYGVGGTISAKRVHVEIEPGAPPDTTLLTS